MYLSSLIRQLQDEYNKNGDVEVVIYTPEAQPEGMWDIGSMEFNDEDEGEEFVLIDVERRPE